MNPIYGIANAIEGSASLDSRGAGSYYVRGIGKRGNVSCQGSEHWYHRREPLSFRVFRQPHTETVDQIALVVQESEVKLRLLEQEETDARTRRRDMDKGKSRMF